MNIRNRFWIVIILTIITSFLLNISALKNKHELEVTTLKTSLLGKQVTALTYFRAGARQSLLDLTEYLYDRSPGGKNEFLNGIKNTRNLLENLRKLGIEANADNTWVDEMESLYAEFEAKSQAFNKQEA